MPEFVKSFGTARLAVLGGTILAVAGLFFYLFASMTKPAMSLLFAGLDPRDSAGIVARLETLNVPFEIEGDGTTILVPEDRALRLRMDLAADGLPAGGSVGYEIFDNTDALGASNFLQNVNRLRALEGELARTIRSLDVIENARVHLVIPERELFARERAQPSASIVIRPRGNRIAPEQVAAIQNLVASAVSGLVPTRVSVVDEKGQLLGGGEGAADATGMGAYDSRTSALEERMRSQIEGIVTSIVGPGRARVQVFADIDYNRSTRETVRFDPEGQVVRSTSTQSSDTTTTEGGAAGGGAVSVSTDLPDAEGGDAAGPSDSATATTETTNYEISSTRETVMVEGGLIRRLSVAVVVDGSYTTAADGTRTYAPRSEEEMAKITALVRSAIGYDEKRGDTLEVANLAFAQEEPSELPPPEEEPFLGLGPAETMKLVEMGVLAGLTILAIFLVFRPMISRLLAPVAAGSAPGMPALAGPGVAPQLAAPGQSSAGMMAGGGTMALPAPGQSEAMIDIARINGQVKESSVKKVGEIITQHPEEAVSIMRQWLHDAS